MLDSGDRRYRERENIFLMVFLHLVVSQKTSPQEHTKIRGPPETVGFNLC